MAGDARSRRLYRPVRPTFGAGPPAAQLPPRRRFHALRRSGVTEVDMFAMPLNSSWIPWLRKWKTDARGCPNSGVLSA